MTAGDGPASGGRPGQLRPTAGGPAQADAGPGTHAGGRHPRPGHGDHPRFDEATVRDVLDDLRTASQATGLAVLDSAGKPQAVSGIAALKGVDLSSSAAVSTAQDRPTVDVWTVRPAGAGGGPGPRAQPARGAGAVAGGQRAAGPALAGIARAHRVAAALVIAEKLVGAGSRRRRGPRSLQAAVAPRPGVAGRGDRRRPDLPLPHQRDRRRGHRRPGGVAVGQPPSGGRRRAACAAWCGCRW